MKVSILASQPQLLNWASVISAFFLLCGAPTWIGSADMVLSQPPISAGSIWASNFASSALSGAAFPAAGSSAATATAARRAVRRERDVMEIPRLDGADATRLSRPVTRLAERRGDLGLACPRRGPE